MHASLAVLTVGIALFTLIEVVIVIGILGILLTLVSVTMDRLKRNIRIAGQFLAPVPIVPPGGSKPFIFEVTQTINGTSKPVNGREVTFTLDPKPPQLTHTQDWKTTRPDGRIIVTVSAAADYSGQATITATDVKTGEVGQPEPFAVV